ncbi:MAG: lipoprotein-releasing ABC transporter permease subunit [Syntrophobacterales bacterium]|nr:lipoprotein-releasing ABC transporter permease subunit [Syntrophobacterales bacterium]
MTIQEKLPFEWFVGFRYFKSRKRQGFLSLITAISIVGVAVGVMALIVVLAVMNGFQSDLRERILGVTAHVVIRSLQGSIPDYELVVSEITKIPEVRITSPFIYLQGLVSVGGKSNGAIIKGVDLSQGRSEMISRNLIMGRIEDLEKISSPSSDRETLLPGIILGVELAKQLNVHLHDVVSVLVPSGRITPMGQIPRSRIYKVVGLFQSGVYDYDQTFTFVSLQEAQHLSGMTGRVMGVELWIRNPDSADRVANLIQEKLGYSYWVRDWMQMNRNLFSALKLEKTAMFIILTLIVLVAAFNIASSLIMLVRDKTKDIAIMKAMGATMSRIRRIFMLVGLLIGICGTILGLLGGFLLCGILKRYHFIELPKDIYYISTLPVKVEFWDVFFVCVAAVLISFGATIYPAYQAARLDPVEALRYE